MSRPHLVYLAIGFPPAAKSSTYRLRETANQFAARGWDVTVLNIAEEYWASDYGLDHSLDSSVDPRIRRVEIPLLRPDLLTDIRRYSRQRAIDPARWRRTYLQNSQRQFPEPHYGAWRRRLTEAVEDIHAEHPATLVLATCVPYVLQAVAEHLRTTHGVPYALDYRDGWSIDVITGEEAFARESRSGALEATYLEHALSLWVVNEPIADHYRRRYPGLAGKIRVVRNGFDRETQPASTPAAGGRFPLTFGYVGTVNFTLAQLRIVLQAWQEARQREPALAGARFEFCGRIGAGANREANGHYRALTDAEGSGVRFAGPIDRGALEETYERFDAVVLILVGGRYVTSGKVYEYMATGLPIVSAHAADHDASTLLSNYPRWSGAGGFDVERLVDGFCRAARLAATADQAERETARRYAEQFERSGIMGPAVAELAAAFESVAAPHNHPEL